MNGHFGLTRMTHAIHHDNTSKNTKHIPTMANPLPFSFDDQHQQYPSPLFPPPGHSLHERDDSFEEERNKKQQKTIENILVASSGAAFTVALVAVRLLQKRLYNGLSSYA